MCKQPKNQPAPQIRILLLEGGEKGAQQMRAAVLITPGAKGEDCVVVGGLSGPLLPHVEHQLHRTRQKISIPLC